MQVSKDTSRAGPWQCPEKVAVARLATGAGLRAGLSWQVAIACMHACMSLHQDLRAMLCQKLALHVLAGRRLCHPPEQGRSGEHVILKGLLGCCSAAGGKDPSGHYFWIFSLPSAH